MFPDSTREAGKRRFHGSFRVDGPLAVRDNMPFIVGAPRSGTTMLRFMLDSHSALAIPPETGFAAQIATAEPNSKEDFYNLVTTFPPDAPAWGDFGVAAVEFWNELAGIHPFTPGEALRTFYRLYAKAQGKTRYGDKTPIYCHHLKQIEQILPEACFIHIIRDGRDTALSLRTLWFAPARDMASLARYWVSLVRSAIEAGRTCRAYKEVRYEDLVRDPEPQLQAICDFVGLDFEPEMLRYWERTPHRLKEHKARRGGNGETIVTHEQRVDQQRLTMECPRQDRVLRWKSEMREDERRHFEEYAGDLLKELGYEI